MTDKEKPNFQSREESQENIQKTSEEAIKAAEADMATEDAATVTEPVKEGGTVKEAESSDSAEAGVEVATDNKDDTSATSDTEPAKEG